MDITIDGQVVGSTQDIIDIAPYRKARTAVRLSVANERCVVRRAACFPAGVSVNGEWGMLRAKERCCRPAPRHRVPTCRFPWPMILSTCPGQGVDPSRFPHWAGAAPLGTCDLRRRSDGQHHWRFSPWVSGRRHIDHFSCRHDAAGERQVIAHTQPAGGRALAMASVPKPSQCDWTLVDTRFSWLR